MHDKLLEGIPKFYGAVTIGERGQVVIPIEARKELGLEPAAKLLVFGGPRNDVLIFAKAEAMTEFLGKAMTLLTQFNEALKNSPESAPPRGQWPAPPAQQ